MKEGAECVRGLCIKHKKERKKLLSENKEFAEVK